MHSPSGRCCGGIGRELTSIHECPSCPRTWVTGTSVTPTGTSPRCRSSCAWPRRDWTARREASLMTTFANFPSLLESFFTQRLMRQRQASPHTIASYRDTWRLLLQFIQKRLHKAPSTLALEDIDAPLITAFLDELEKVRGVTARTRNLRLTAVHSFFRYAAFEAPSTSAQIQRVLAIPAKRFTRALV